MSFIVKNTTFCSLIDLVCPHSCRGCGATGEALCDCCKNDIILNQVDFCPNCKGPVSNHYCAECQLPPMSVVGVREQLLARIIHDYKYRQSRALATKLAEILDQTLPVFADPVTVVPLPTIRRHIRERGFDHMLLLAKKLAKLRGWSVEQILTRAKNTVQVGSDQLTRERQAREAYALSGTVEVDKTYLLLDDVWTTGASMKAALKKLQGAGAFRVFGAVLAVSRIDH